MKLKIMMSCAVIAFALLTGISSAQAQADEVEKANVPFDFYAGGQKMPAGTYMIWADLESKTIRITDAAGDESIFMMGIPADGGSNNSELVFEHHGNDYALEEVRSDLVDLVFKTNVPEEAMESSLVAPAVEIALNRM